MGFHIAIIGGGISGLSAAYYLQQQAAHGHRQLQITVFERKAVFGGNADTVAVKLGQWQDAQGQPRGDFVRWADLGVNDVNLSTYHRLSACMADLGYLQHMRPLQDTESYFTADGRHVLTDDARLFEGVSDPRFNLAQAEGGELARLIKVVHQHALDLVRQTGSQPPKVDARYTVARYFDDCIAAPEGQLWATARDLGIAIDWTEPALGERLRRIRDEVYYPRISAMYFTDDRTGPGGMPLQSPFQYYQVQEGSDQTVPPNRCYFAQGAQHWLDTLASTLEARSTERVRVRCLRKQDVTVRVSPAGAVVTPSHGEPVHVDLVLTALHADDTLRALDLSGLPTYQEESLRRTLSRVRYTRSHGVCHTDDSLLPRSRAAWRTYNVLVHPRDEQVQPYRMSYVENFHQNDAANPALDRVNMPMYFTSLLPDLHQVNPAAVLERVTGAHLPEGLLGALPHLGQAHEGPGHPETGYTHELEAVPAAHSGKAWALFKHNVLDLACIEAQARIQALNEGNAQQPQMPLFFGGGWTNGAGLHEQCMAQSEQMARWAMAYLDRH